MPTYEYRCHTCGYHFDVFQSIVDEPVRICPVCSSHEVRRLLTGGSGFVFKGSGFYTTDYKNKTENAAREKEEKKEKKEKE